MSLGKGIVGSIVGGGVGAVAWAGVTYATGWHVGLISIVVGGLAGYGMAQGTGGRGGRGAGIAAAVVALLAVLSGDFAATQLLVRQELAAYSEFGEEQAIDMLAAGIFDEMAAAGEQFEDWDGEGWPEIVAYKAHSAWNRMSTDEQLAYLAEHEAEHRENMAAAAAIGGVIVFVAGLLSLKSVVIMGLGVLTAYRIGSRDIAGEAAAQGMGVEGDGAALAGFAGFEGAAPAPGPKARPAPAPAADEAEESGFRLPMARPEREDNLPSIEEIRRKHAAAAEAAEAGGGDAAAEGGRAEAA